MRRVLGFCAFGSGKMIRKLCARSKRSVTVRYGPKAPRRSESGSCTSLWVEVVTGAECILSNLTHAGEQRKSQEHSVRRASQPVFRLGGMRFTELQFRVDE